MAGVWGKGGLGMWVICGWGFVGVASCVRLARDL